MDKQIQFWRRRVAQDPNDDMAIMNLARLLFNTGKKDKSEKIFVDLLKQKERDEGHEIARTLVLSTAHISEPELDLLNSAHFNHVYDLDYGFLFWVPSEDLDDEDLHSYPHSLLVALPNVVNLIVYAYNLKCQWLHLDSDGDINEDLERFN